MAYCRHSSLSIDQAIGNLSHLIRIGIDQPLHKDMVSDFVLSNFINSEKSSINNAIAAITENFKFFVDGEMDRFVAAISSQ